MTKFEGSRSALFVGIILLVLTPIIFIASIFFICIAVPLLFICELFGYITYKKRRKYKAFEVIEGDIE